MQMSDDFRVIRRLENRAFLFQTPFQRSRIDETSVRRNRKLPVFVFEHERLCTR